MSASTHGRSRNAASAAILVALLALPIMPGADIDRARGDSGAPAAPLELSEGLGPSASTTRIVGVLVLKYFPLTPDGQLIDINVTGDVGDPVNAIRARVDATTASVAAALSEGSRYRGYADLAAVPGLAFTVVDTKEFDTAVPSIPSTFNPNYTRRPDYAAILRRVDICSYVRERGVREVWIWAYNGPHALDISESKMSGPYGDISNSYRLNDMPACGRTYTVYTYNYGRGTAEALEDHGHQIEAELSQIDQHLFRDLFEGPNDPATRGVSGRCGSIHNPPNARFEYDRANSTPNPSDCLAWTPNGLGPLRPIGCAAWGCEDRGDVDNPARNYQVWWMQNLPGAGNKVSYGGRPLRDWWDVYYDFDTAMGTCRTLVLPCPTVSLSISRPASVARGDRATVTGRATVGATCTARVTYPSRATKTLSASRPTTSGLVAWSWNVPWRAGAGKATIRVTCTKAGAASAARSVTFAIR